LNTQKLPPQGGQANEKKTTTMRENGTPRTKRGTGFEEQGREKGMGRYEAIERRVKAAGGEDKKGKASDMEGVKDLSKEENPSNKAEMLP